MQMFFKVFLMVMGILNVVLGFLTGEILNIILGTIFVAMVFIKKRLK